jgi:hypothetical protein
MNLSFDFLVSQSSISPMTQQGTCDSESLIGLGNPGICRKRCKPERLTANFFNKSLALIKLVST